MTLKNTDLKIRFLGVIPVLEEGKKTLTPEQISAFSALLTFKGKSIQKLLQETIDQKKDIDKKTKIILNNSSLRGHASIATTPALAFYFEGSKFLDSMLTGIPFSSSLMASGRRTDTTLDDIVYPISIFKNQKARKIYKTQAEKIINFFSFLLKENLPKDDASKILTYGIYGTGVMVLPVESIVGFYREYQLEKNWLPKEGELFLSIVEKEAKNLGIGYLFSTRKLAPKDIYPYPNIFKNPKNSNLVREIKRKNFPYQTVSGSKIISYFIIKSQALKEEINSLLKLEEKIFSKKENIKNQWQKLIEKRRKLIRDYNLAVQFLIYSSCSWRVWGEKKRHRTVPQIVESIYYSIEQTLPYKKEIEKDPTTAEKFFVIPSTIKKNPLFLKKYCQILASSLITYQQILEMGVSESEAIFIIPRALKIDLIQSYNFYNLISGYYPTRLCSTVEPELSKLTWEEVALIKKILKKENFPELGKLIQIKCQITGFCHEKEFCTLIKSRVLDYDENFHQSIHQNLLNSLLRNGKSKS